MNKYIVWILGLVLIVGLISAGGILGGIIPTDAKVVNVDITLNEEKSPVEKRGIPINDLNGITYTLSCNGINCEAILNKKIYAYSCITEVGVETCENRVIGSIFQDKKINFVVPQECVSWSVPVCEVWEERPVPVCLKYDTPIEEIPTDGGAKDPICIEWEAPKECLEFDAKTGECFKWETELKCLKMGASVCSEWTKGNKDAYLKIAIENEIISISEKQAERNVRVDKNIEQVGTIKVQ